jgi:6-phosphogluconolactonase
MNPLLPLTLSVLMTVSSLASDATFYLGTYTKSGKSKGIYVGKLDTETGKLGAVELAGEAKSPSFVALSPNQKSLYASLEDGGGSVGAFAVGADGKLKALNIQPSGGAGACHVWVDTTGKNVLAANYGGGSIIVFQTKPDGSLGERTAFVQFEGSGPDKGRQAKPHGHSIYTDATNKFVYSCDLGTDNVWIFKFDAEKGTLTPANPPSGKVPPGAGPRHFALSADGKHAYANNEMGLSVTAFSRDPATGSLTAMQTLPTLPEGANPKGVSTAEIFIHPTGKWLYVSNRAHDTIAVYAIGADGRLTWIENAPAAVKVPRGFGIDPSGKWMVTAGQDDNRIAVLKIDPATGKLSATDQSAEVGSPVCVLFAPAK